MNIFQALEFQHANAPSEIVENILVMKCTERHIGQVCFSMLIGAVVKITGRKSSAC